MRRCDNCGQWVADFDRAAFQAEIALLKGPAGEQRMTDFLNRERLTRPVLDTDRLVWERETNASGF